MVGIYYLAASVIFPDEPEEWPDFDAWYDRQNRLVIAGLLTANILSWIGVGVLDGMVPTAETAATAAQWHPVLTPLYLASGVGILVLLGVLLKVTSRRWNVALLSVLILLFFVSGVIEPYA